MIKSIKKAIVNTIRWASYNEELEIASSRNAIAMPEPFDSDDGLRFKILNAIGGKVVEIRKYDPIKDRSKTSLYIITDKEDLGQELAQIITVESLSR